LFIKKRRSGRINVEFSQLYMSQESRKLDLQKLRQETAADHLAVEGALPLMNEGLDRAEYAACLSRIYGLVSAWEERAAAVAPDWMRAMLAARQRAGLLQRDLAWLGVVGQGEGNPILPEMNNLPSLLGTMYVMEGSTLGGQLIARHVEAALDLSEGEGDAYFRGHGKDTGAMWKEFCEVLANRVPDSDAGAVVLSAKEMFAVFGAWVRGEPVIDGS